MTKLQTRTRTLNADIFVVEGERAVGVVLYHNDRLIAVESFDAPTLRRLKTDCLIWIARHRLTDEARIALIEELRSSYEQLEAHRHEGPNITHDWLGSHGHRRLPHMEEPPAN